LTGDDIIYFRTLDDYKRLLALTSQGQRFAVGGGGFIGSEVAAALAMNGKSHDETAELAAKVFELSQTLRQQWLTADYAAKRRILEIVF
jgi:NAD(P)H-nitrite reductase large subunit